MRLKIFLLFVLTLSMYGVELDAQLTIGARAMSMGQAGTAVPEDHWSVFMNPALMDNEQLKVGFYGLRNYGFAELTDMAATASVPVKWGVVAVGIHRYGNELYSENRVRAAYKNSWRQLHIGLVLNYNHISFGGGYGSGNAMGMDAGIAAEITNELMLGAQATNLNQASYTAINEDLPRSMSIGMSYHLEERALFVFDVVKDVKFPISWRGGVDVEIADQLYGRLGVTAEPFTYSFGFGYRKKLWEVNMAVQKHQLLGFSPGLDLLLFF
ncbi:MAG: hypothetical protein FH748_06450 [Balneolaceae bacterium]|nr:hypothetical protein [Balneolaceae bacterium]